MISFGQGLQRPVRRRAGNTYKGTARGVCAWSRVCGVAIILCGVAAPVPSEAGTIDVPMRRGQATTPVAVPDSAWGETAVAAATVLREIEVLRVELGVGDEPPEAELQLDRLPHTYTSNLWKSWPRWPPSSAVSAFPRVLRARCR